MKKLDPLPSRLSGWSVNELKGIMYQELALGLPHASECTETHLLLSGGHTFHICQTKGTGLN